MPRSSGPSRPVSGSRVVILTLIAVGMAGCSDSGRFEIENPFKSDSRTQSNADVTGSVATRPATTAAVQSQPLPAPSRPQTVAAANTGSGVAQGAGGLGAYRPPSNIPANDVTGSIAAPKPAAPTGHWTWEGGTPITVGAGETVETIGRHHGVPVAAILQANNIQSAAAVKPGQRLVIPRYVLDSTTQQRPSIAAPATQPAPRPAAPAVAPANPKAAASVHVVQPGESLMALSRRYGIPLSGLAAANNIPAHSKLNVGDRIAIPATAHASAPPPVTQAPQPPSLAKPGTVPVAKTASVPAQTANVARADVASGDTVTKSIDQDDIKPTFRWPVRGRVISGFGPKTSGQQNDGINIAVPEGTEIKAAEEGVVAYAGNELKGYGNLVLIRHPNGYVSAYAHASELTVKRGDAIKRGQTIARAGQTGNVTSPQLHFEIRKGSTPVDPARYLGGA